MSLKIARMASRSRRLRNLKRTFGVAGFAALSCNAVFAQERENVFRLSSMQLTASTLQSADAKQDPASKADEAKAGKTSEDVIRFKPEAKDSASDKASDAATSKDTASKDAAGNDQAKTKNREPIVLPALPLPNTSIAGVGTGATPEDQVLGRLPPTIPLPYGADRYGFWNLDTKTWNAPVFCHQPVYFEDTMLERHGHERAPCIQPLLAGTRFFSDVIFLPYNAYLQRPLEERYNTGHYRPGSAAPAIRQRSYYDPGAMRFQLLTTGTTVLAFQP